MEQVAFIVTVFFILPRPMELIPCFGELMRVADVRSKQGMVILGAVITSALCTFGGLYGIFFIYFYGILHVAWAGQAYSVL